MNDAKIRQYRKLLGDLRDRLAHNRQQLREQVEKPVGNTDYNDIETSSLRPDTVGTSEGEEEVAMGLYASADYTLGEVEAVLARIPSGKFGVCEGCGKKIEARRLDAIPYVRQCMTCAKEKAVAVNG